MKKKQSQCQRLLAYMKKHRKGITTREAFQHLDICCLHKRVAELPVNIKKTPEITPGGARAIRYKLA